MLRFDNKGKLDDLELEIDTDFLENHVLLFEFGFKLYGFLCQIFT